MEDISILEVEKGAIRKFADAVEDQNPLYSNEEYSNNSRFRSIIAPPGFFGWPDRWPKEGPLFSGILVTLADALKHGGYSITTAIDAKIEYEFFHPVHAGDTLTAKSTIIDIAERQGSEGKTLFATIETDYSNQQNRQVAKVRWISILR